MHNVARLNSADDRDAKQMLQRCCAATRFVDQMLARRPFADASAMAAAAGEIFWSLDPNDWLEAFAAHPQIGDMRTLKAKYQDTRSWSQAEQSGVDQAPDAILERLAAANAEYLDRFGYIFIVCATGKTAFAG